ncbi:MAG TPA: SCO family protein [Gemmatimonadales bacterium]|nr:SCO family protein [Gemmatimonadales bacterium]
MSTRIHWLALRAALGLLLGAAGCKAAASPATRAELHGAQLTPPKPKPDFTLTSFDGKPFHFRQETDGYLTLLFFGYTHCPDVCPVHMANLGAVMKKLPARVTERVRVVFVTTDPRRDTPDRLKSWLGHFDPTFIGLTGSDSAIRQAEQATGMPPAQIDTTGSKGFNDYGVGHAAFVIAYTPDNLMRVMYPSGIRQSDWAEDLPRLVEMTGPSVEVKDARVLATPNAEMAVAYFKLRNTGSDTLTLQSITTDRAREATLHQTRRAGNMMKMQPAGPLSIAPGKSVTLESGGYHLMLNGFARPVSPGDSLTLTLKFANQGDVKVVAPVRSYAEES